MAERDRRWCIWGPALLAAVLYLPSLLTGFTIDDPFVYSDNAFVRHLGNVRHLFDRNYFVYSNEASYRPVCTLTYIVDAALWGGRGLGPHLTNVLLYAAVVAAVGCVALRLTGHRLAACVAAVLFAVHPVHGEVVCNIGFREDLLAPLFVLAAWLAFRRGVDGRPWLWLPLGWLLYFLAALAKESVIVFPVLFVLLEWAREACGARRADGEAGATARSARSRALLFVTGLAAVTVLFLLIRFKWMRFPGEAGLPRLGGTLGGTLLADVQIQAYYLLQTVAPLHQQILYGPSFYPASAGPRFWLSLAALLAVVALAVRYRRAPLFLFAGLWWVAAMAPVSNLYPIFNPMAERYLFLPGVAVCIWAGAALAPALEGRHARAVRLALLAVAAALAMLSVQRIPAWRDDLTLWRTAVRDDPSNPTALVNLAAAYYQAGDYANTEATAEQALRRYAAHPATPVPGCVYLALGTARQMRGDRAGAEAFLLQARAGIPMRFDLDAAVHRNLGLLYDDRGDLAPALESYRRAAAIDPFRPDLWRKIAFCELRLGARAAAARDWARARALDAAIPTFEAIEALYRGTRGASGK